MVWKLGRVKCILDGVCNDKTDCFEHGIFLLNFLTISNDRTFVHQSAGNPVQHKFKTLQTSSAFKIQKIFASDRNFRCTGFGQIDVRKKKFSA